MWLQSKKYKKLPHFNDVLSMGRHHMQTSPEDAVAIEVPLRVICE
jgi:hypothetical protein